MRYLEPHFLGAVRNGVNQVQMNMNLNAWTGWRSVPPIGPIRNTNYPDFVDTTADPVVIPDRLFDWYKGKGFKSARLLLTWEALQNTLGGRVYPPEPSYADYWSDLVRVVKLFLSREIYVTLGLWQHAFLPGAASITGAAYQGKLYKDGGFTSAQFADFWGKFAAAINLETGGDQRVAFDLIPNYSRSSILTQ